MASRLLIGPHGSIAGWTDKVVAVGDHLGATGPYLYMTGAGHQPSDALLEAARSEDGAMHFVRLPTQIVAETTNQYLDRIQPLIDAWMIRAGGLGGRLVFIPGNEPDIATGDGTDVPTAWAAQDFTNAFVRVCGALRRIYPGIVLANPAWSVEHSGWLGTMMVAAVDWVTGHAYWNGLDPDWERYALKDEQFGQAWRHVVSMANGKPVVITEANSVGGTQPDQIAAWLKSLTGVYGVCLYMADGQREWAAYDVSVSDADRIMALSADQPDPLPDPQPGGNMAYTRDHDPRGYVPLRAGWFPKIASRNPEEVDAILAAYTEGCQAIRYDANAAVAQGWVETDGFTSNRWKNAHAAAGVGIYEDGTPDIIWGAAPHGDARTGILAQCELLNDYYGNAADPWNLLKPHGLGFDSPLGKTKLSDMDGVWAADTGYSAAIVAVANEVTGDAIIPVPPLPKPAPWYATTAKTGAMIAAEALKFLGSTDRADYDPNNGHGTPYLWCEAFAEAIPWRVTGIRVPFYSALLHGQALDAAGRLHHDTDAPAGAWMIWGAAFWPDGHIVISLGDGRYIGTTVDGIQIGSGWQYLPGYMGWAMPDGVTEGATDMRHDGKLDAGLAEYLWRVGRDSEGQPIALNPASGIFTAWRGDLLAGVPWGEPRSQELAIGDGSGRVIQVFALGIAQAYPDGSVTFN